MTRRHMRNTGQTWTTAALLWTCVVLAGCGEQPKPIERGVVLSSLAESSVRQAREILRLGRTEGDGPDLFGRIRFVSADDRGRVYVGDETSQEVRVFDAEGRFVRTLGREGAGPGEFRGLSGLAFDPAGRAWIWDPLQQRFSVFDTSGAFDRNVPRPWTTQAIPWPGVFSETGFLLDVRADLGGLDPKRRVTQTFQHGNRVIRFDTLMAAVDSSPTLAVERTAFAGNTIVPFEGGVVSALDSDAARWFTHGTAYRIMRVDAQGDTVLTLELDVPPVPVTGHERDSALSTMRLPPSFPELDPELIPTSKPAIVRLVRLGSHWVGAFPQLGPDTGRYMDVFSPDGHHHVRIDFRTALTLGGGAPYVTGGRLYGVTTDELDVPLVVVFDLGIPELKS